MKICNKCKREVEDDMLYCPYCGASLDTKNDEVNDSDREHKTMSERGQKGMVIGVVTLIMLGVVLVVAGMISHWLISVVGGILVGTAISLYQSFLKK